MFCAISCSPEKSRQSSTALTRLVRHKMQSAIWKKVTRTERWPSLQNEMTTSKIDNSQRIAAKVAGIARLLAFVLVVFGKYVLLGPLIVPRNAADTARNILAPQTQFRSALACFITYDVGGLLLLTPLYLIFPHFNKVVNDYIFDSPLALFELIVSFWLLFKGLKPVPLNQSQADAL